MNTQITTYNPMCRMPTVIPEAVKYEPLYSTVEVIVMPEDHLTYCDVCQRYKIEKFCDCKLRTQKCGFPIRFKLKPITVPAEYDPNDGKTLGEWWDEMNEVPSIEWYCGDKEEDYEKTLVTFNQRYDSIIAWLARQGYIFNPSAPMKLNKPNGFPATFQTMLEELHNWLLFNRGHTGIDDWIIAISKINYGASLRFIGSFIGNEKSGLVARICELKAMKDVLPSKVKVSEAKKLGYSKSELLRMGYKEKQFRGTRFMVLETASNL